MQNAAKKDSRFEQLLIALITILAATLIFSKLGEWSFWIEEYHTVRDTQNLSLNGFNLFGRELSYLITKPVFVYFGVNEWTARLIPAMIGVISVPLLFWMVKKLFDFQTALISAILLALSPWHLFWSQNARFYTLFLLFFNLSIFAFVWGLEKDKLSYMIASLIAFFFAFFTHQLAILLIPLMIGYVLLLIFLPYEKPQGLHYGYFLFLIIIPIIVFAVYEVYRVYFMGEIPITLRIYTQYFNQQTRAFIGHKNPYVMLTAVVYYVGTSLAFLSLFGSFFLLRARSRIGLFLALSAFAPLLLFMLLTLFASVNNRYLFMTLPSWIILGAVGARELFIRARNKFLMLFWLMGLLVILYKDPVTDDVLHYLRVTPGFGFLFLAVGLACLIGVFFLDLFLHNGDFKEKKYWSIVILFSIVFHPVITDTMYFAYQQGQRDNRKEAVATIMANYKDGDRIVARSYPLIAYYSGEKVTDALSIDLNTVLRGNQRVWFIEDTEVNILLGNTFENWLVNNCTLYQSLDVFTTGRDWKLRVYLYDPAERQTQVTGKHRND
jgi:4-amino-4-deoxy-L-arabinose transferase-like glycosyltransferase